MKNKNILRPGHIAPVSGQYGIIGQQNKVIGERTAVKGEHLPPTPKKGQRYRLIDKTRTKINKK